VNAKKSCVGATLCGGLLAGEGSSSTMLLLLFCCWTGSSVDETMEIKHAD
jgi:hypothetical protein